KLNKIQANLMEIKNKSSYGSYPISNRKSLETKEDLTTSTFGSFVENKNVASMPKQVVHEQVSFMSVDNNNLMYKSTMEEDVQEVKNATPSAPQVSIIEDNEFSFNSEFFDAKPAFKTESNFEASSVNAINYQKENINANVINKKEEIISKNTLDVEDFSNSVLKSLNKENRNSGQITNAEKVNTENYKSPNVMFGESVEEVAQPILPKKTINYNKPPIELLTTKSMDTSEVCDDVVMKREELEMALDTFGIPAKVIGVVIGPAVTRYELEMPAGVSIKRLIALQDDIAYNLSSNGDIRIEAPIPGRRAVGIEVPNEKIATVALRDIILSREFMESKSSLAIALGKDISGMIKTFSLVKVPHLLIAGTSGSGKSVCINAIILSLIYKYSPDEVKLILVDPKRVEFSMYNHLPHLIMPNVITDSEKALNALNWCVDEMERRYIVFANARVKNLEEYNESEEVLEGKAEKMPYIIFIIDELADLLMTAKKEAEEQICRILQKARAAGIHMILATQRPSVDVVTGKIKTNLNARICFALMTSADSKTVLDQGGADKLLGKGDMLFMSSDTGIPKRIQGCFVTTKEIDDVVTYVKENNGDYEFDMKTEQSIINPPKNDVVTQIDGDRASNDGFDALMPQVLKSVIENGHASISMIQRKFLVGFPRAARIIDQMENAGYISPSDGSKSRSVYITMEEYDNLYGEG
ncbi:MAG: DNA translocase FtsK, partial [Clostridia bacterium]|nr:DNA translocase FtsK [Clostridia bacterium]